MQTEIETVDTEHLDINILTKAARLIKEGEIVAFPTETVYGLGADALNAQAVKKIFDAKGRPADNPLIVHINSIKQLNQIAIDIPEIVFSLAEHFWPGPLTFILKKHPRVPSIVTGGLDTVAVRYPNNLIAQKLIELTGAPIAAPSANISGKPSPTRAEHVYEDFEGKIPLIIDGGETTIGVESTVVNLLVDPPIILRPGGITYEMLKKFIPHITVISSEIKPEKALSPGMKYRHYAPLARLILVYGEDDKVRNFIDKEIQRLQNQNPVVLCLHPKHDHKVSNVIKVGKTRREIQRNLFKVLRELDEQNINLAFVEAVSEKEEGLAIMNRLKKAATETIQLN
ncbi:MAG: L-threonylcarbamoyladenylate synthase [Candidatus Heimdallarchaeaceae archaeon]